MYKIYMYTHTHTYEMIDVYKKDVVAHFFFFDGERKQACVFVSVCVYTYI